MIHRWYPSHAYSLVLTDWGSASLSLFSLSHSQTVHSFSARGRVDMGRGRPRTSNKQRKETDGQLHN
jgi:hypothetical protein